jgi:DNA (cytosine-5)-methyltransferase 1
MGNITYSAVSLFSGAGGLDLGFHNTGRVRSVACYEYDPIFSETLRLNRNRLVVGGRHPEIHQHDLSSPEVVAELKTRYGGADIVFGGPPCQSFSIMGKTSSGVKLGTKDPRGQLVYSFLNIIEDVRPLGFLFENVPNIVNIEHGSVVDRLSKAFRSVGYGLWSGIICAADYGARTFRKRFFIIGIRDVAEVPSPKATHMQGDQLEIFEETKLPWNSSKSIFETIRQYESSGRPLANHEKINHSEATKERFGKLAFGETDNIRKRNRIDPSRPAHSVYVGGKVGKLQARTHIHPYEPRELTARECALIQGFPIDWLLAGRTDAAVQQAANAVPVELACAMATHIVRLLDRRGSVDPQPGG